MQSPLLELTVEWPLSLHSGLSKYHLLKEALCTPFLNFLKHTPISHHYLHYLALIIFITYLNKLSYLIGYLVVYNLLSVSSDTPQQYELRDLI